MNLQIVFVDDISASLLICAFFWGNLIDFEFAIIFLLN